MWHIILLQLYFVILSFVLHGVSNWNTGKIAVKSWRTVREFQVLGESSTQHYDIITAICVIFEMQSGCIK